MLPSPSVENTSSFAEACSAIKLTSWWIARGTPAFPTTSRSFFSSSLRSDSAFLDAVTAEAIRSRSSSVVDRIGLPRRAR